VEEQQPAEDEEPTISSSETSCPLQLVPTAPRPVTPTGEPIDSDIKALLEPFIDLDGVDFLKANSAGGNRGLRAAIKAFGCSLQLHDNKLLAQAKQGDEDLNTLGLKAINSHSSFLDRYCCPPRKSCIQGFIALATLIDKEEPAVDIFQLTKRGGKGRSRNGNKLVPIIPTTSTEPRSYPDNARQ
jgi:hypothetical protein